MSVVLTNTERYAPSYQISHVELPCLLFVSVKRKYNQQQAAVTLVLHSTLNRSCILLEDLSSHNICTSSVKWL